MSVADRLNKLTTDITNAYTSINNKGGTIPANKNTDNLHTAIDSIEVIEQATAEGESLNLTNTKAMPYKDYVVKGKSEQNGEPSPSNPSEIHSVADDVNLFDASKINNPTAITVSDNGETITMPIASSGNGATSTNATLKQLCPDLQVGDYIYLNFTRNLGKTYNNLIYLAGSGKEIYNASVYSFNTGTTITQQDLDSIVYLYGNRYSDGETQQCIITDFKIQKNKATPYSPYNQGTVTIKQRGKNLFNVNNILSTVTDYTITIQDGGFIIRTGGMSNGGNLGLLKNLCPQLKVGDKFKFNWDTNATRNNSDVNYIYLNLYANTIRKDITYTCTQEMLDSETYFYGQQGQYYKNIIFYLDGQTSDYEPYQANDYTFQTEPLRSLPNGVKDTIEADGIHRRVGRQILGDVTELIEATVFGTPSKFASYGLQNAKNENRNYNFMSDKLFYANEQFIKYGTYRNQTALIVLTTIDDTLENFNLKISGSEVLYELEEEIIEPLTQNQATTMLDIIKTGSYEGTTNIYTNEDVKPTIGVGYYKKK